MKLFCKFLLFTSLGILTAINLTFAQNDPKAKAVLDGVSAKFKTYKAVQASFVFTNEDASGKVLGTRKGTLLTKGNKYRITLVGGQDIFCDGTNVWTLDKAANEVTVTKIDPSSNSITPQKLFTNFYDKDFLYKLNGEKKMGNRVVQEIELTPIDKTRNFFKVYLWIDKAAKTIYSTKVMEKSGNRYTYTVATLNGSANIPDAQFVFDAKKFPGVEIIDLR